VIGALFAEGNGLWLPHDINEVYLGTAAFLVIVGLLWWKAGPPIKRAMVGRTERIAGELEAAATRRAEAEAERDRIREALADSESEAERILAEAREAADRVRANIAERTEVEIAQIRERAAADLEATRRNALADLTAEVSRLSLGAAEKVVEANLDDATQQALIESYISQVGSSN
jgi:F-type H+-transporting ATPase subunit b